MGSLRLEHRSFVLSLIRGYAQAVTVVGTHSVHVQS
jgi:hypothetical protein